MRSSTNQPRFFVVHLNERDRPAPDQRFEVQVLDPHGRTVCCGYFGDVEEDLEVEGRTIPRPVIEAARRQPLGRGDYVDESGYSVPPF